ncbi:MAG TPA: hypothetical protein VFE33_25395, partial [Thermoanaerobaculia bacterium]|nr:hypothetical protein [Thermoanaerobaculia bacterium]
MEVATGTRRAAVAQGPSEVEQAVEAALLLLLDATRGAGAPQVDDLRRGEAVEQGAVVRRLAGPDREAP